MTTDMIIVFTLAIIAIVLFISEKLRSDIVGLVILTCLAGFQVIDVETAFAGFSNSATLTVLAMFVLSEAVAKSGMLDKLKEIVLQFSKDSFFRCSAALMVCSGVLSMFINNTAIVALSIPVVIEICREKRWSASKILMPISFASMFGGVCTLIGTSTNLLANDIIAKNGLKAFSMFDFFKEGFIFFIVGLAYLFLIQRFIPQRKSDESLEEQYEIESYLFKVKVLEGAPLIGKYIYDLAATEDLNFEVLAKITGSSRSVISVGDELKVRSDVETLQDIQKSEKFEIIHYGDSHVDQKTKSEDLIEAIISPHSNLDGAKLSNIELFEEFNAKVVAIRQRKGLVRARFNNIRLRSGDSILLFIDKSKKSALRSTHNFVIFQSPNKSSQRRDKIPLVLATLIFVVLSAAFNIFPILLASFMGIIVLLLFNALKISEMYKAINWQVIFLLAGLLALGEAMVESGGADYIANQLNLGLNGQSKAVIAGAFFALSSFLTAFMSNNASVALLTPIGVYSANYLGVDSRELLLAVIFGASISIFTPIGYQTNMMVYNIGQYKFKDFFVVGMPLTLIYIALAGFVFS